MVRRKQIFSFENFLWNKHRLPSIETFVTGRRRQRRTKEAFFCLFFFFCNFVVLNTFCQQCCLKWQSQNVDKYYPSALCWYLLLFIEQITVVDLMPLRVFSHLSERFLSRKALQQERETSGCPIFTEKVEANATCERILPIAKNRHYHRVGQEMQRMSLKIKLQQNLTVIVISYHLCTQSWPPCRTITLKDKVWVHGRPEFQ